MFAARPHPPKNAAASGFFDDDEDGAALPRRMTTNASFGDSWLVGMHYSWKEIKSGSYVVHSECLFAVVNHRVFRYSVHLTILLSAVQMGIAADFTANDNQDWNDKWRIFEHVFTSIFVLEMLMKIITFGVTYFFDPWNVLDCFVATAAVIDVWIVQLILGPGEGPQILKMFRLFRLLRVVKLLRAVPELMLVTEGIVNSLKSMFWVFLLLAVILYTVGIYCVEAIGSEGADYAGRAPQDAINRQVVDEFNNYMYFGSVSRSMVSLFSVILLAEWTPIIRPVWERQPAIIIVFVGLVVVTTFGVLNVIIGVVVERTTAAMNSIRDKNVKKKKKEQMKAFNMISTLMFEIDTNDDMKISKKEMEEGKNNEKLHELLQKVDFPHGFTYTEFHAMLDQDGSGHLSQSEFINGMLRLVYNDQFQRDCMFQLTMGQIKANQRKLHKEMKAFIQELYSGIKHEIYTLRTDMVAAGTLAVNKDFSGSDLGLKSVFVQDDDQSSSPVNPKKMYYQSSASELKKQASCATNQSTACTGTEINTFRTLDGIISEGMPHEASARALRISSEKEVLPQPQADWQQLNPDSIFQVGQDTQDRYSSRPQAQVKNGGSPFDQSAAFSGMSADHGCCAGHCFQWRGPVHDEFEKSIARGSRVETYSATDRVQGGTAAADKSKASGALRCPGDSGLKVAAI